LCGRPALDAAPLTAALGAVLPLLHPGEAAAAAAAAAGTAGLDSPPLADLLLSVAQLHGRDAAWRSWALPLVAGALVRAQPPAPPPLWLRAALLAAQVSKSAEEELVHVAARACPHSLALTRKRLTLGGSAGPLG